MNTILFAAARHAARRRLAPAPLPQFHFADDRSAREFERELRGDQLGYVPNTMVLVTGGTSREQEKVIHALLKQRGKNPQPVNLAPKTERELRIHIESALRRDPESDICLAFSAHHLQSHALEHYSTPRTVSLRPLHSAAHQDFAVNPRFYLTARSGITLSLRLARRCRVIELADF